MTAVYPFLIAGLVSGSVYGLAGTGLVLTYKTSGVFNFAHGALATIAAYLFYTLHVQHGLSWPVSAVVCVLALGVGMGFTFELFARRIVKAPIAQRIAGTVGALILVEAGATLIYGTNPLVIPPYLPHGSFTIGGVVATVDQVIVVAVGVVATGVLYIFLQRSRTGIAMRAVVDDPDLISLSQFNPHSIRRGAWTVGCVLATLAGVLIAPSLSLDPTQLTLLVVQAFGAAAIGRFTSLPLTYVGGLVLGVASSVATKYVGNNQFLGGLPASIPFIVLFLVLIVTPKARLRLASVRRIPTNLSRARMPGRVQVLAAIPPLALAAVVPFIAKGHVVVWASGLAFVILFASMVLLVRVAGQVSLCHVAFAAIGASTFARLAGPHHWPWFLALLLAALCVVPIGAILAIPASRLPILYLGLATLGFGLLVQQMFYGTNLMFSAVAQGLTVGRPHLGGLDLTSDRAFYYLVLVAAVLSVAVISILIRTRLGRVLVGLSDSPLALNALGADERVTRVLVFCLSAFFAGLSGALYAGVLGNVSEQTFDPLASLTYLVVIVIAVGDPVWASIGAAVGIAVIPGYIENGHASQYLQVAFGLIAIGVAIAPRHQKLRAAIEGRLGSWLAPLRQDTAAPKEVATSAAVGLARRDSAELDVRGVNVLFGGLRAVNQVSLQAKPGVITGLIGPNGAGKTTTFNVCSGLVTPTDGEVRFAGRNLRQLGAAKRARLGLGRTFQHTELFTSMTVKENVALGCEASMAGASPWSQLIDQPGERKHRESTVTAALDLCGITDLESVPAASLSTGQRRMVELARAIASPARLLLLDEPSAGLDQSETREFGAILRRTRDDLGLGILLVEHDMDLVMSVCDYLYVLDFGELIFQGTTAEVQASALVQQAYLGESLPVEEIH